MLGGEVYAFADSFDYGFLLRHDLEGIIGQQIPFSMFPDSESLINVIVKSTTTTEKRLMINVKAARKAYDRAEISDVGWICSENNLADGLTKAKRCDILERVLETGPCDVQAKQWIVPNVFSKDGNDNEIIEG